MRSTIICGDVADGVDGGVLEADFGNVIICFVCARWTILPDDDDELIGEPILFIVVFMVVFIFMFVVWFEISGWLLVSLLTNNCSFFLIN